MTQTLMTAIAIEGGLPGIGSKGDERSGGWFHLAEATGAGGIAGASGACDGRGAAGIEDDEVALSAAGFQIGNGLLNVEEPRFCHEPQCHIICSFGLIA